MKLLVVTDKWSTRFFVPDHTGSFIIPFISLIEERLDQGFWYKDQFKDQAEDLVRRFHELMRELPDLKRPIEHWAVEEEELEQAVTKFLEKRRRYEYEEWEICSTVN